MRAKFYLRPTATQTIQLILVCATLLILVIGGTKIRVPNLNIRGLYALGAVITGVVVWIAFTRRQAIRLVTPMDIGWIALGLGTGLSVLLAPQPRAALEPWLLTIAFQLPFAYCTLYLARSKWSPRLLFRAILVIAGVLYAQAAILLIQYALESLNALQLGADPRPYRLWGVLDNPAILGMFVAITSPLIIAYLFAAPHRLERVACVLLLLMAGIVTLTHATRSATLATTTGLVAVIFLVGLGHPDRPLLKIRGWARRNWVIAGLAGGLLVIACGFIGFQVLVWQGFAPNHAAATDRLDVYRLAIATFRERPLSGAGPAGVVRAELRAFSVPPYQVVPHAHNMVLNTLADSGLIGVIGLGIWLLSATITCLRAWLVVDQPEQRLQLAGLIAGLIGFLAAGVLDSPMSQPGLFLLATCTLMMIASYVPPPAGGRGFRVRLGMIGIGLTGIVLLTVILAGWYAAYWSAVSRVFTTSPENFPAQRQILSDLEQLRTFDPHDPLLLAQIAYRAAYSQQTPAELRDAIDYFERVTTLEPDFSLHWINLSALYSRADRLDEAIQASVQATRLAPQNGVAWLNVGIQFERSKHQQSAYEAYLNALEYEPLLAYAPFWNDPKFPLRADALETYRVKQGSRPPTLTGYFASGQYAEALNLATQTRQTTYRLAAKGLSLMNSDPVMARIYLLQATRIENPGDGLLYAYLGLARIDSANAAEWTQRARIWLLRMGIEGFGSAGNLTFANNLYWRAGLISDYLSGVLPADSLPDIQALIP
jgi:O-antigen ligase